MATIVNAYSPNVVVHKLPTFQPAYNPQSKYDPEAYYTKALGFLPVDTRYLANPTNTLAYNSMADVLFNKAAQEKRWEDNPWMQGILNPLRLIADTALLLKEQTIDPVVQGVIDDGWSGFLRGGSTALVNGLVNLGNTLDVASNPIKGFIIEGIDPGGKNAFEGFYNGLFGDENGRKQYDYNEYIDWGDGFWNNAGEFIVSMGLEIISDPLNWFSLGTKQVVKTGADATATTVLKSARKSISDAIEAGVKNIDELVPKLVDATGVSDVAAKKFLTGAIDDSTKTITKAGVDRMFDTSEKILSRTFQRAGLANKYGTTDLQKLAQNLGQSTKSRYKAGLLDRGIKLTPGSQKFTSEYLMQSATKMPDILSANKYFKTGAAVKQGVNNFETALRYTAGATGGDLLYGAFKGERYLSAVSHNKSIARKEASVIRGASELNETIKFDAEDVNLVKAVGGNVEAAAHKEIFDDLLKVKDNLTNTLSTRGKQITKADIIKTANNMKKRADNIVKKLKNPNIKSLDDYINHFKNLGTVADTTDYVNTLEVLKKYLTQDYTNKAVLDNAMESAKALRKLVDTTLSDGQDTAIKTAENSFRRWRKQQAKIKSVTDQLNDMHRGIDNIMEWLEGSTEGTKNIKLLDNYMEVAKNALNKEKSYTIATPDFKQEFPIEGYYTTFKEAYENYRTKLEALNRLSEEEDLYDSAFNEVRKELDKARKDTALAFQDLSRSLKSNARFPEYNINTASVVKNRFGAKPLNTNTVLQEGYTGTTIRHLTTDKHKVYNPTDDWQPRHLLTAKEQQILDRVAEIKAQDPYLQMLYDEKQRAIVLNNKQLIENAERDIVDYWRSTYGDLLEQAKTIEATTYFDDVVPVDTAADIDVDALTKFVQDLPETNISKTDVLTNPAEYVKYQLVTYQLMTSKTSFYLDLCGIDSTGKVIADNVKPAPLRTLLDEYADTSSELYRMLTNPGELTEVEFIQHIQPMRDLLDRMQGFINFVESANKLTTESGLGHLYQQGFTDQIVTVLNKYKKLTPYNIARVATELVDGVDLSISSKLGLRSNAMDNVLRDVTDAILKSPTSTPDAIATAKEIIRALESGDAHEGATDVDNWLRMLLIADESGVEAARNLKANFIATLNGRHAIIYDTETIGTTEKLTRPYQIAGKVIGPDLKVVEDFNIIIKPDGQLPYESVKRVITPAGENPRTWFKNNVVNNPNAVTMDEAVNSFYDICHKYNNGDVVLAGQNIAKFDTPLLAKQVSVKNKYSQSDLLDFFNNVDRFDSLDHFNIRTGFKLQGEPRTLFTIQVQRLLEDTADKHPKLFGQNPFSYKDVNVMREFEKFASEKGLFKTQYTDAQYHAPTPKAATSKTAPVFQALDSLRRANPTINPSGYSVSKRVTKHIDRFNTTKPVLDPAKYAEQAKINNQYLDQYINNWYITHPNMSEDTWETLKNTIARAKRGEIDITPTAKEHFSKSIFKETYDAKDWYGMIVRLDEEYPRLVKDLQSLKDRYNPKNAKQWAALLEQYTDKKSIIAARNMLTEASEQIDEFIDLYTDLLKSDPDRLTPELATTYAKRLQELSGEISKPADIAADTSYFADTAAPELLGTTLDLGDLTAGEMGDLAKLAAREAPRSQMIQTAIDDVIKQWQAPSKFKGAQYFTVSKLNHNTFESSVKTLLNDLATKGLVNVQPGTNIMEVFTRGVDSGNIIVNPRTAVSYEINDIFNATSITKQFSVVGSPNSVRFYDMEYMQHQMRSIKRNHASLSKELVDLLEPKAISFLREIRKPRTDLPKGFKYFTALRTDLDVANKVAIAEYYYNLLPADHALKIDPNFKLLGDRTEAYKQIKANAPQLYEYDSTPLLHRMNEIDDAVDQPRLMYETDYYNYKAITDSMEDTNSVDALLKYYLDHGLYNINEATKHHIVSRTKSFFEPIEEYLASKGELRSEVEKNIRKINTRLYERSLMEILERPDRVASLKAEAKVRASRVVFSTRSKIDLSDFKMDSDFIVKDNVLLDAEEGLYGHAILIKRAGYDNASSDVKLTPKMIESLTDKDGTALLDAQGMQYLVDARKMNITDAHVKNLGYSRGDVLTKQKVQTLDEALVDLGWFTKEELALIPSANDLDALKYFDDLNANNSIIGTFSFYNKMFDGDIQYVGDPFKQTLYNIRDNCYTRNTQAFVYASTIMNEHNNIKTSALFEPLTAADKFKLLHNNADVGVYIIRKPTVKNAFYSDFTGSGVVMEEIKIVNMKSIELAENLGAYVIPRNIAVQAMQNLNDFKLPKIAQIAKDISDIYKVAYLGTAGFLIRNFIDSNYKTRWGLDGEVSLPKQVKHLFSTMQVLNKYQAISKEYYTLMQKDFTSDLDYHVFYTVCKNLDAGEDAIIKEVTQGLTSERLQERAAKLAKKILKNVDEKTVSNLRGLNSKLLEPDVFSIVDAFDKYGPNTGLSQAVINSSVNPKATNPDRTFLQKCNNFMTEKGPFKKVYSMNEFIESSARLSMFLQDLERGSTLDDAVKNVIRTHFDYSDKSLKMMYTEIVFPFMSFSYKNMEFWVDSITRNPMLIGELENIMRSLMNYQSVFSPDLEAYEAYDYKFDWSKDVKSFQANAPWTMINAARLYHILNGNVLIQHDNVKHDFGYGEGAQDSELYTVFKLSPSALDGVKMLCTPINTYSERLLPPYETMLNVVSGLTKGENIVDTMSKASLINTLPYLDTITQRLGVSEDGFKHNNMWKRTEDAGPHQLLTSIFGATYVPVKDSNYWYDSDYNILGGFKQNYYAKQTYSNPYNSKYPSYTLTRMSQNRKPRDIYAKSKTNRVLTHQYNYYVRNLSGNLLRNRLKDNYYYY